MYSAFVEFIGNRRIFRRCQLYKPVTFRIRRYDVVLHKPYIFVGKNPAIADVFDNVLRNQIFRCALCRRINPHARSICLRQLQSLHHVVRYDTVAALLLKQPRIAARRRQYIPVKNTVVRIISYRTPLDRMRRQNFVSVYLRKIPFIFQTDALAAPFAYDIV